MTNSDQGIELDVDVLFELLDSSGLLDVDIQIQNDTLDGQDVVYLAVYPRNNNPYRIATIYKNDEHYNYDLVSNVFADSAMLLELLLEHYDNSIDSGSNVAEVSENHAMQNVETDPNSVRLSMVNFMLKQFIGAIDNAESLDVVKDHSSMAFLRDYVSTNSGVIINE